MLEIWAVEKLVLGGISSIANCKLGLANSENYGQI